MRVLRYSKMIGLRITNQQFEKLQFMADNQLKTIPEILRQLIEQANEYQIQKEN